jgi:hypothetical protein
MCMPRQGIYMVHSCVMAVAGLSLLKPLLMLLWGFRRYLRRKARVFLPRNRWCPDGIFGVGGALGYGQDDDCCCGLLDRETGVDHETPGHWFYFNRDNSLHTLPTLYRNTAVTSSFTVSTTISKIT